MKLNIYQLNNTSPACERLAARGQVLLSLRNWFVASLIALFGLAGASSSVHASDPVGVYALVDKVVIEPSEGTPERIQVHGSFCLAEGGRDKYASPKTG